MKLSTCIAEPEGASGTLKDRAPRRLKPLAYAFCLSGIFVAAPAWSAVEPTTTLGKVGSSDLQIRTGDAVQTVCGQFIAADREGTPPANDLEADLFDKCGEMVHTARTVTGDPGATAKSLDLTEGELQGALQNIAGEEVAASGSIATEVSASQMASVSKRMANLLSRVATLQLSAAQLNGAGVTYAAVDTEEGPQSGGNAGEGKSNKWGFFVNADIGSGEKDATADEDGFSVDSVGITGGVDYRMNPGTVLGLALGYNDSQSDFDTSSTVSGGDLESKVTSLSTYGLFYSKNAFFDATLTLGTGSYDMNRVIKIPSNSTNPDNNGADRVAASDTDSTQVALSFGAGSEMNRGSLSYAPYLRAQYLKVDIDGFTETGASGLNLKYEDQEVESATSTLGFRLNTVSSTSFGVVVPQARAEWVHEYSNDEREIKTFYVADPRQNLLLLVTDKPDRDYFNVGLGLSAVFKGGVQAFIDVRSLLGMQDFKETVGTVGVRMDM